MNFVCQLCFKSENAEYFADETVWIFLVMRGKRRYLLKHKVYFILSHSFNDKFLIMAEEKEASAAARTLASFENLISIMYRTQTLLNEVHIINILLKSLHKQFSLVIDYLNV